MQGSGTKSIDGTHECGCWNKSVLCFSEIVVRIVPAPASKAPSLPWQYPGPLETLKSTLEYLPEDGTTDTEECGSLLDGDGKVVRHSHGEMWEVTAVLLLKSFTQLAECFEGVSD